VREYPDLTLRVHLGEALVSDGCRLQLGEIGTRLARPLMRSIDIVDVEMDKDRRVRIQLRRALETVPPLGRASLARRRLATARYASFQRPPSGSSFFMPLSVRRCPND
jgi:hypothetical protein